jgi:putative hemolysin
MKNRLYLLGLGFIFCALIASGCDMLTGEATEVESPESAEDITGSGEVGLANPASVYCEDQGYVLEIRTGEDGGQYGVCIFPDGSECEEWAYYRGECAPASEAGAEADVPEAETPDVVFEGISFSYDNSLASAWTAEIVPATTDMPDWGTSPEHIEFLFEGYVLPNTFHEPRIYIYPIADYIAVNPGIESRITEMQQLLAARPDMLPEAGFSSPGVPFLPLFNAGQMVRANGAYLDFQNGTGVRFLTQYGQAFYPINNYDMFYTFQGITSDGAYYVAVIMPASNPILPADGMEIPGDDPVAFGEDFDAYASDIAQQLEAQSDDSFTPNLALLDAMVQSLLVTPTQ